jgi:tRNA pseudouridine55 synthase
LEAVVRIEAEGLIVCSVLSEINAGVLAKSVVCDGRAAKAAEYLAVHDKSYAARLRLGLTTDTEDTTGAVLSTAPVTASNDEVVAAAASFLGEYRQTPPMYSALKVNGQKLVDLARRGIAVEREARPVTIHAITCAPRADGDYDLQVTCSSGTYIRTLCADIGKKLGCGGAMAALRRTETGGFSLVDCTTLDALEQMDHAAREAHLLPVEALFATLSAVHLPAFYEKLARSGCEIYQKKIDTQYEIGTRVRVCNNEGSFFALGEVREYKSGSAVKLVKLFALDTE